MEIRKIDFLLEPIFRVDIYGTLMSATSRDLHLRMWCNYIFGFVLAPHLSIKKKTRVTDLKKDRFSMLRVTNSGDVKLFKGDRTNRIN